MYIEKEFRFEAAHRLEAPGCDYGKCQNFHGHGFILKVRLYGSVRDDGMIMNFTYLKQIVSPIIETLDHSFLNDSFPQLAKNYNVPLKGKVTTCEIMADAIGQMIKNVILKDKQYSNIEKIGITLFETATSSCYNEISLLNEK